MNRRSARELSCCRRNLNLAERLWPNQLQTVQVEGLKELTGQYSLSVAAGDLQFLDGKWYVTHSGLLRIAQRRRCCGIKSALQERLSDPAANRWIFKATVYKSPGSKGFVGYGDADPSNVSPLVRGAEMRIAETRAVNCALRKAYGIGLCSIEETTWFPHRVWCHLRPAILTVGPSNSSALTPSTLRPWRLVDQCTPLSRLLSFRSCFRPTSCNCFSRTFTALFRGHRPKASFPPFSSQLDSVEILFPLFDHLQIENLYRPSVQNQERVDITKRLVYSKRFVRSFNDATEEPQWRSGPS